MFYTAEQIHEKFSKKPFDVDAAQAHLDDLKKRIEEARQSIGKKK